MRRICMRRMASELVMVFSSPLFLSLFLPILLLIYALARLQYRNAVLLAGSLFFYSWGEARACLVMMGLILVNYVAALAMHEVTCIPPPQPAVF